MHYSDFKFQRNTLKNKTVSTYLSFYLYLLLNINKLVVIIIYHKHCFLSFYKISFVYCKTSSASLIL